MPQYENSWFFGTIPPEFVQSIVLFFRGLQSSNFTSTQDLFLQYPQVHFWRFEVVYSFATVRATSALNFQINQPPSNGSCSISALNGTTRTPFTISCVSWFDEDGIQDYSIYGTTDRSKETIFAFSVVPEFQVRLPADAENETEVMLIVRIRDRFDCLTEYNLSSVIIRPDRLDSNLSFSGTLASGNQNLVGQFIISIARQLNQEQNLCARIREDLVQFTTNLTIGSPRSIQLQASALAELTSSTSQLTRVTSVSIAQDSLLLMHVCRWWQ